MKQGSFHLSLVCAVAIAASPVWAQLPVTQLTSIFPSGGKQGTSIEVKLAGSDMDELETLVFNHPGLRAVNQRTTATELAPSRFVPNQFIVTIGPDVPPGTYEVRARGRFGLSNPRSFVVGSINEVLDGGNNSSAEKALDVTVPATINGRVEPSTYDFFRLNLRQGERVLIDVAAKRIDSRLDATLVLLGPAGREVARAKATASADPVLDFTAPVEGSYLLKLYDLVYGGGEQYFYRLMVGAMPLVDFVFPPSGPPGSSNQFLLFGRNLPGGEPAQGLSLGGVPLEKLPVIISLPSDEASCAQLAVSNLAPLRRAWQDGIEFRLPLPQGPANAVPVYFAKSPTLIVEEEPNNDAKNAQRIAVPCECAGQFYPQRDIDWVRFDVKKGRTYWIEVISHQLGLESDPAFVLYRVTKDAKGEQQLTEVAQADDSPDRARRIGTEFDATSDDPAYKLTATEDATFALMLRDQFGDWRKDPSWIYRLAIREPAPDFRLLAHPTLPAPTTAQTQNQTLLAPLCIRKGGTAAAGLVVQRRDEFSGEIVVSVEGLPPGVTCPGAVLGGNVDEGSLVFIAAEDASAWAGPIKIIGRAVIDGREVMREARYAAVVWGSPNRLQQPPQFRLTPTFQLGVIEKESDPALVQAGENKVWETSLGGTVEIPIKISRRGDFNDRVRLVAVGLPQQMRPQDVTVSGSQAEAKLRLQLNQQNVRPGVYTIYLRGESKRRYTRNPDAVAAAEAEQKRIAEMIKRLQDDLKSATEANDEAARKAAEEKLKEANQLKEQADKHASDAKQSNQPKDVSFALVSTPIKLRIYPTPIKIVSATIEGPIKQEQKRPLAVKLQRLFDFAEDVELSIDPPQGIKGLSAQKVSVKKGQDEGKLEVAASSDATPGEHACTLRARGRFNGIQVESTSTVTLTIEAK